MRRRPVALGPMVALVVVGAVTTAAGHATGRGATSAAPREQQTFPRVIPRVARRHSTVAVYFTLAAEPGHQGVLATEYRVQVDAAPDARASCAAPPPSLVDRGRRGEVKRVALLRPSGGWCVGRYRVTVFLQRGPYCPDPGPGEPPRPCPLFASREVDVGRARFTVRREDATGRQRTSATGGSAGWMARSAAGTSGARPAP